MSKSKPKKRIVKAWALVWKPDNKIIQYYNGVSVFPDRKSALGDMPYSNKEVKVVSCTITYTI